MKPAIGTAIVPAADLSVGDIKLLVEESERAGWSFVRRLADNFASGANRFNLPGEVLFVARENDAIVGVCGLNADPYVTEQSVGRVRHLYVLSSHRDQGVGRRLVQAVVSAARTSGFHLLRVRTENPHAARLYERLGFRPVLNVADCTHVLQLVAKE